MTFDLFNMPFCTEPLSAEYILNGMIGHYKGKRVMLEPRPKRMIFNDPATIVFWEDGTKTIVKCSKDETFSPYFGFLAALAKKIYGTNSAVQKIVDQWADKDNG